MAEDEQSEAFYDALAPLFDVMTDWEARLASEGPFLRALLEQQGARRVLDAACGSGGHALALARWGYEVVGADSSAEMVRIAEGKAAAGLQARFVVAGLEELPRVLAGESFDAVLCLGNSLPHLLSDDELAAALGGMAAVLRPGGIFVTQNLNYDLRWQTRPRWFAAQGGTVDGRAALVWRFADYDQPPGMIAFHIALLRAPTDPSAGANWAVEVHTTAQRPLLEAGLRAALAAAGCSDVQAYASMSWPPAPFDPGRSGDLVMVGRRAA